MVAVLLPPEHVRLYGTAAAERERSRGSSAIRIDFDRVQGAEGYEAREGSGVVVPVRRGGGVAAPGPNKVCRIEVRAVLGGQASVWSAPLVTVSRPPVPEAPTRAPFDLSDFGIVLDWRYGDVFPGVDKTLLRLYRDSPGVGREQLADGMARKGRFVDTTYLANMEKRYELVAVTAREAVPHDLLDGHNLSFESVAATARGPHSALRPGRIERSLSRRRGEARSLLTLFGYAGLHG